MSPVDLEALCAPFPPGQVQWRLSRSGKKDSRIWARCLPFIGVRAIQARLDEVCGADGWRSDIRDSGSRLQAGIGIWIERFGDWVWKWDGTGSLEPTPTFKASDAGKGDHSNAIKRAATQWGISRYLGNVPEQQATVHPDARFYGSLKKSAGGDSFRWDPPALPPSALPLEEPAIVVDMRELLLEAGKLGLGGDEGDQKALNGIRAIERSIEAHDRHSLLRARPWLEGELEKLKAAA